VLEGATHFESMWWTGISCASYDIQTKDRRPHHVSDIAFRLQRKSGIKISRQNSGDRNGRPSGVRIRQRAHQRHFPPEFRSGTWNDIRSK